MSTIDEIDDNLKKENETLDDLVRMRVQQKQGEIQEKTKLVKEAAKLRNMVDSKLRKHAKTLDDKEKEILKEKSKQLNKAVIRGKEIDIGETQNYVDQAKGLV